MPSLLGLLALGWLVALAACAPFLFRYADRRIGSDEPHPKSTGYPPVIVYALVFAAYAWLSGIALGWAFAGLVLAWCLYRSLGWKVGGSMTPRTVGEILGALARHSLPALAWLAMDRAADVISWLPDLPLASVIPLIAFAFLATDQVIEYARFADLPGMTEPELKRINARLERERGFVFGIAFLVTVMLCALRIIIPA